MSSISPPLTPLSPLASIYDKLGRSDYIPDPSLPLKVLGWCQEAIQTGDYYLRNQKGYGRANEMRRMLLGDDRPFRLAELSTTSDNELARLWSLTAAQLTDWEPFWGYETNNDQYSDTARIQSKYLEWWFPKYGERPTELMVKDGLTCGASVAQLYWDRNKQEIGFDQRSSHDILPVFPDSTQSFDGCLAVIDRRELPIHYVWNMFPHAKDQIKPDRDASISAVVTGTANKLYGVSPLMRGHNLNRAPSSRLGAMPVVDLYRMTIDDRSINEESFPVEMGDWGYAADGSNRRVAINDFSYIVEPGQPLYPIKRLIIFTNNVLLYDGPNMYWYGYLGYNYFKFCLEAVPDTWFGRSPLWPLIPLQHSLNRMYRAIDDHVAKVLNPGKIAPRVGVAQGELRNFKTNMPGQSIRYGAAGKPEVQIIPDLDRTVSEHIERLLKRMGAHAADAQSSMLATLSGAGQIPEGTTVEKMMHTFSPQIRAWSRSIEAFERAFGASFAFMVAQFITATKRVHILGDQGRTIDDFDIDPDSLVPAYTASDYNDDGSLRPHAKRDPRPRMVRALEHLPQFSLLVKPASMLQSAKIQDKLLKITMRQKGDLDLWSAMKVAGIDNIGPEPDGNVYERTLKEKMLAAGIVPGMPLPGAPGTTPGGPPQPSQPPPPSHGGEGPLGPHNGPGRPHTWQEEPNQRPDGRIETSK